jgi:uncharacterized protein
VKDEFVRVLGPITAGLIGAVALNALGIPLAWLTGAAIAAMILNLLTRSEWKVPSIAYRAAVVLLAVTVASGFSADVFTSLGSSVGPIAVVVVSTALVSILFWRGAEYTAQINSVSALLGTIPAGASGMIGVAADQRADVPLVAALQYVRLVTVVMLAPVVGLIVVGGDAGPVGGSANPLPQNSTVIDGVTAIGLAAILGVVGYKLATLLRIPTGLFVGPLAVVALAQGIFGFQIALPGYVTALGLMVIGIYVGIQFDQSVFRRLGRPLIISVTFVFGLIAACGVFGLMLYGLSDLDLLTSLLATMPGGLEVVAVTAFELNADASMVIAIQMTRLALMLILLPFLIRWAHSRLNVV